MLLCLNRFFFFWFVRLRLLVHVLQLSWLPNLRNKCTNNFFWAFFCFVFGGVGDRNRGSTGILFLLFWKMFESEFCGTYHSLTWANWDVCLKHLITCGLHLDVAKETNNCAIIQLLFFVLTGRFNLYIAERLPSRACFVWRCDFPLTESPSKTSDMWKNLQCDTTDCRSGFLVLGNLRWRHVWPGTLRREHRRWSQTEHPWTLNVHVWN